MNRPGSLVDAEELSSLRVPAENVTNAMIESMFLEVMSDNESNAEQINEMASTCQPNSSRASLDSARPVVSAEERHPSNTWLSWGSPVIVTRILIIGE